MADEIGGISAEITGDASSLFSTLQRAEAQMREFNSRYGNLAVKITLQAPTQAMLTEIRTQIIRGLAAGGPIEVPVRAVVGGGGQSGQITRVAAPASVAAAPVGPDPRIAALEQANAAGKRVQYRDQNGSLATVYPTTGGGAMGGGGGYQLGGVPIVTGGPRGYTGNEGMDIQRLQEQAARAGALQEEVNRLRAQAASGPSVTQVPGGPLVSRSIPLPPGVSDDPRLATGFRGPGGRIISAAQIQAMYAQTMISRGAAPATMAGEVPPESTSPYTPPPSADMAERERELRALTGEFGPEAQAAAEARQPNVNYGRRRRGAAAGGVPVPLRRIGPEEREAITSATPELEEGIQARIASQTRLIQARQETTVRSTGTFLTGLVSNLFGGSQAREAGQQAAAAIREQGSIENRLFAARGRERDIEVAFYNAPAGSSQRKEIRESLNKQRDAVEELSNQYQAATKRATDLSTAAEQAGKGGLRNLAAGFVGGIAGSLVFGAGITAITKGVELLGTALAPQIERLTNYGAAAGEVATQLAAIDQQRAGLGEQAVASVFAQAGFKGAAADQVRSTLLQQTQVSGGLGAFDQQRQLLEAAFNFQHGIGVPGITSSVGGGLFGVGANKGLIEQVRQQLETTPTSFQQSVSGPQVAQSAQDTLGLINAELSSLGITLKSQGEANVSTADALKQQADIAKLPSSGAGLGGSQAKVFADTLADRGLVVTATTSGRLLSGDELLTGIKNALGNLPKPAISDLIAIQQPQIDAQRALFREQAKTQRESFIPAAFALQQAASPTTRFGTGFVSGAPSTIGGQALPTGPFGAAFGGAGQAGSQAIFGGAFAALSPMIGRVDTQLAQMQKDGQAALEALVPTDQIGQFRALEKQITDTGAAIAGLQAGAQQEQTNFQVAQYNEQLRLARQSQSDLLQLTGREGQSRGDNLGLLEKQVIESQRYSQELALQSQQLSLQSNALSLQLAQRQINFRLAVAGFGVPGETAEERAARVEEAKKEAEFAQKQLDIQKQQQAIAEKQTAQQARILPISFKIQDIGFNRELVNIQHQIGLINQGIKVSVDTAAAQQAIEHLTALENQLTQQASTYVTEGTKVVNAYQQAAADIKAQTAAGFSTVLQQTATAWGVFLAQGRAAVQGLSGGPGGLPPGNRTPGGHPLPPGYAQGMLGIASSATPLIVGEAGAETVAILRNPRAMAAASGFGGGGIFAPMYITISGNNVRNDADIEMLAAKVARRVSEMLSRTASQLGLRSPA